MVGIRFGPHGPHCCCEPCRAALRTHSRPWTTEDEVDNENWEHDYAGHIADTQHFVDCTIWYSSRILMRDAGLPVGWDLHTHPLDLAKAYVTRTQSQFN